MDLRRLFTRTVLLSGFVVLLGCAGKPAAQQVAQPSETPPSKLDANPPTATSKPAATIAASPARSAHKPASQLKVPEGLAEPPSEMKMATSAWDYMAFAQVGDTAELEMNGMRTRVEIFDIADKAAMQIMDMTTQPGEKPMRIVTRLLFTEPELDPRSAYYVKFEKKPSNRKFTVGGKEYQADTVTEGYQDGKLVSKTWTSKQVPIGSLLMEDGTGKVTSRLISFERK